MKPAAFEHHAPETIDDVVGLLDEHGDEAKVLAGGQSLVPMLAMRLTRFEHLIDVNRVSGLAGIRRENGSLVVGATTRQAALERTPETGAVPLLTLVAPLIGHFQIRNRGTVGGSVAHADPAAELPAVALALEAEMEVASGSGTRRIAADDFFVSTWETALADGDLLTAIHFPVWSGRVGFAIDEVARRHGDFALTGAVCGVELDEGGTTIQRVAIAMLGMGSTPLRASAAETALTGAAAAHADLDAAARLAVDGTDPPEDIHASARFRTTVGENTVRKALRSALAEASNA